MGYKRSWQQAFGGGELGSFGKGMAAASIIQRAWRKKKMRRNLALQPFSAYRHLYPRTAAVKDMLRRGNIVTAGQLATEYKYCDIAFDASQALTAPADCTGMELPPSAANTNIFTTSQGDTAISRDGNKIMVKEIMIRGHVYWVRSSDAADVPQYSIVALWLVLDTQTNGAACNSEDVFQNTSGSATLGPYAYKNTYFGPRFRILKKWFLRRPPIAVGTDGANTMSCQSNLVPFSYYKKCNIPVTYAQESTGLITDIRDNSLHLMGCANSTDGTPSISWSSRIRFVG